MRRMSKTREGTSRTDCLLASPRLASPLSARKPSCMSQSSPRGSKQDGRQKRRWNKRGEDGSKSKTPCFCLLRWPTLCLCLQRLSISLVDRQCGHATTIMGPTDRHFKQREEGWVADVISFSTSRCRCRCRCVFRDGRMHLVWHWTVVHVLMTDWTQTKPPKKPNEEVAIKGRACSFVCLATA